MRRAPRGGVGGGGGEGVSVQRLSSCPHCGGSLIGSHVFGPEPSDEHAVCRAELAALRERAETAETGYHESLARESGTYSKLQAVERERDEFRAICDEMNALSGEELHLAVDVIARRRAAERSLATLRGALTEIKETCGQVCSDYDTCAHGACMGSHRAWEIATAALADAARGDDPEVCRCRHRAIDQVCCGPHPIHRGAAMAEAAQDVQMPR